MLDVQNLARGASMARAGDAQAGDAQAGDAQADAILGRLMLAFRGATVPGWLRERLGAAPVAGFTLFRADNVRSPRQLRRLTAALQSASGQELPLLIATDQEGGQLLALGDGWTPFAGPMAIGATGDADLAERVGRAIGRELRAVGVNVNYAPVLDIAAAPGTAALGIRSFGDDPAEVGRLGAAWLRGVQSAGVAATGKHFPGAGGVAVDTHYTLGVLERSRAELVGLELAPFQAAIEAGLRMVMSGHFATPALTDSATLPSTLSRRVMDGLLRDELGFRGVSITDALDMKALPQDATQAVDVLAALQAGVDLLLATADRRAQRRIESALRRAAAVELLDAGRLAASEARITALRSWLAGFEDPPFEVVGSRAHAGIARELAERSLTLVRDEARLLPLRISPESRIAAIMPAPRDLTPADTSSFVRPGLAPALRAHHPNVEEIVTGHPPTADEIAAVRARAAEFDLLLIGTINVATGSPQAELVEALRSTERPLVTVALRAPWDILAYPRVSTHLCTYSILPHALEALAAALFGRARGDDAFPGRLPVAIPGLDRASNRSR